jgi:hypothetical protein
LGALPDHPSSPGYAPTILDWRGEFWLSACHAPLYRAPNPLRPFTEVDALPIFVVDEVDANVGGETAWQVGQKLKRLGRTHQVLRITYLKWENFQSVLR